MTRLLVIGGYGYVGRSLVLESLKRGWEAIVVSRRGSAHKRPWLKRLYQRLGVREVLVESLTDGFGEILSNAGGADVVVNAVGVNRGTPRHMYISNAVTPYILFRGLGRHLPDKLYIHISAYVPDPLSSVYGESKALGERLFMRLAREGMKILIPRPGLIIGRLPTHPEWRNLYLLSRKGISIETGNDTGFTPVWEIIGSAETALECIGSGTPYSLVLYRGDPGLITRYFTSFAGREALHIRLAGSPPPYLLPRHGLLGFIRSFIHRGEAEIARELYMCGYRPETRLREALIRAYRDLELLNPFPTQG